jgi:carbonic anhydrase
VFVEKLSAVAMLLLAVGCDRFRTPEAKAEEAHPAAHPAPAASATPVEGHDAEHAKKPEQEPRKYDVPFAWEVSKTEPLAKTRAFLLDALADNESYRKKGEKYFEAFASAQTPRATVVSCADSRVHSHAWDATPDNDDFTIRNIGNQVANAKGSVEYGIEHLKTPLLLIVGHTGCGAVKAAMGDTSKLAAPIRDELKVLNVPKPAPDAPEERAWADAVTANVNNQVGLAVQHFGQPIREGMLTVVGSVYDLRGDLGGGRGKLHIVNVNGNAEAERMRAFTKAIGEATPESGSVTHASREAQLIETLRRTPGFSGQIAAAEH